MTLQTRNIERKISVMGPVDAKPEINKCTKNCFANKSDCFIFANTCRSQKLIMQFFKKIWKQPNSSDKKILNSLISLYFNILKYLIRDGISSMLTFDF